MSSVNHAAEFSKINAGLGGGGEVTRRGRGEAVSRVGSCGGFCVMALEISVNRS